MYFSSAMVWLFSLERRDRGSSPALAWGVTLFFGKQTCAKKRECKLGFEPETCCSSGASTTTAQLRHLVMEADRVGIYPFNLELKFVTSIFPSYLIQI